jgi:hypothetical protein
MHHVKLLSLLLQLILTCFCNCYCFPKGFKELDSDGNDSSNSSHGVCSDLTERLPSDGNDNIFDKSNLTKDYLAVLIMWFCFGA